MPNRITNHVYLTGEPGDVVDAMDSVWSHESMFDFNVLIPMPSELEIFERSGFTDALIPTGLPQRLGSEEAARRILAASDSDVEIMIQGVRNWRKHGHPYWYGWRVEHWGTKWSAYSISELKGGWLSFETAWAMPHEIFIALSAANPDVVVRVEFADEDIGRNCGLRIYCNGEIVRDERPAEDYEEPAILFACRIKGRDPAEYIEAEKTQ